MTIRTYIGLGSNLGDSQQILSEAVVKLASLGSVKVSSFIKVRRWVLRTSQII